MMDEDIPTVDVLPSRLDAQKIPQNIHQSQKILKQQSEGSGVMLYSCQGCERKFKNKRGITYHTHEDGTKGRLERPNKKYKTLLYGHYVCLIDECQFKKEPCPLDDCRLKNHAYQEKNDEMGKIFNCRSQFWKHVTEVHSTPENLIYNCAYCSSKFALQGMKEEHQILRHIRPYICDYCGIQFGVKSAMTKHERLHTGEKPYKCKHCEFVTNTTSTVSEHVRRRHDTSGEENKVYPCDKCNRVYATEFARQCHVKDVHEKKILFHCQICGKGFSALRFIKMHVKTVHLGIKDFGCTEPLCNYRASSKGNLDKHTRKIHGMVIPIRAVKPIRQHKSTRAKRSYEILDDAGRYSPTGKEYLDLSITFDSTDQLPEAFKGLENYELVQMTNKTFTPISVESTAISVPNNENHDVMEISTEDGKNLQDVLGENSEDIKPDISNCAIENGRADVEIKKTGKENVDDINGEICNRECQHDNIDDNEIIELLLDLQNRGNTSVEASGINKFEPIKPDISNCTIENGRADVEITKTEKEYADDINAEICNKECQHDKIDDNEIIELLLDLQDMGNTSVEASGINKFEPTPLEETFPVPKKKPSIDLLCPILTCPKTFTTIDVLNSHLEEEHGLA